MGNVLNTLTDGFEITVSSRNQKKYLRNEHTHCYHELHVLLSGTAKYFIGHDIFHLTDGDFIFIQKGLIHQTLCSTNSNRLVLCFTDDFLMNRYEEILEMLGTKKRLDLPFNYKMAAEALLNQMEQEYLQPQSYSLDMCRCFLYELLILFYRHGYPKKCDSISANQVAIQDAAKYIAEHYNTSLSLPNLAARYAMSPCHFSRTFKSYTGFGVIEYINLMRISHAEMMLASGQYSITEVATKCGYNNSDYFSSVFKKNKGMTPRSWINRNKI